MAKNFTKNEANGKTIVKLAAVRRRDLNEEE